MILSGLRSILRPSSATTLLFSCAKINGPAFIFDRVEESVEEKYCSESKIFSYSITAWQLLRQSNLPSQRLQRCVPLRSRKSTNWLWVEYMQPGRNFRRISDRAGREVLHLQRGACYRRDRTQGRLATEFQSHGRFRSVKVAKSGSGLVMSKGVSGSK